MVCARVVGFSGRQVGLSTSHQLCAGQIGVAVSTHESGEKTGSAPDASMPEPPCLSLHLGPALRLAPLPGCLGGLEAPGPQNLEGRPGGHSFLSSFSTGKKKVLVPVT